MSEILSVLPPRDLEPLARGFAAAALEAGEAVLGFYNRGCAAWSKADRSPITEADEAAERIILAELARLVPTLPVVSEEHASRAGAPAVGREFILVDPLDGTIEFLKRNGEFTVNIALVRDGAPICGVVLAPALRRLWVAAGEVRAFDLGASWRAPPFHAGELLRARPRPERLTALASRSHADPQTEAFLSKLPIGSRTAGGSSIKFCLLAEGKADVYARLSPTMEWDTAAGDAVLRAAGGMVEDLDGGPLRYGKAPLGFRNHGFVAWGAPPSA